MNIIFPLAILIAIIISSLVFISLIGWWRGVDNIFFPGLGLVVAMPGIIVLLLIFNIIFVVIAGVIKPKKELLKETEGTQNFEYPNDIFSGCGNGVLDLSVVKNPENWGDNSADHHLNVCINYDDIESICDVIAPNRVRYEQYREGEDHTAFQERNRKIFEETNKAIFEKAISDFPMLGRIRDVYADYIFTPEEVKLLRQECLVAQKNKISPTTDLTLRKLIFACDEALKDDLYLEFSGD